MTVEEAAEVILGTHPYIDCPVCIEVHSRGFTNSDCKDCKAWGVVLNPVYVEATRVLGMKPPPTMEASKIQTLDDIARAHEHRRGR